jgi:putative transcriptional regulator
MRPESMEITHEIGLTSSVDILRDITDGVGPSHSIVSLGCAGWSAGQLDHEMTENVWLNIQASADLVFGQDSATLWQHAFDKIGIDPAYFAGTAGNA